MGALEDLLARQEIADQLHRYCRSMDRIDNDLGRSVFWPDSVADYGPMFQGTGHGFIDFVSKSHENFVAHAHRLSNVLIEVDGDAAGSESYVRATFLMPADAEGRQRNAVSTGRYVDRWARRDGRWAIAHRRYIHEWDEGFAPDRSLNPRGARRDRDDASYSVLRATPAPAGAADDEALIRRTLALYGPLLDERRFEDFGALFTEDATWTVIGASFTGRAAITGGVSAMQPQAPGWVKHLGYPAVVQLDGPAEARAWSDVITLGRDRESGAWSITAAGRYHDRLRKVGGRWLFSRRAADIDRAQAPLPDLIPLPAP